MIRLLTEADRQATLEFLAAESAFNLFILADIHNYGFVTDFQQVWGDFSADGRLRAVLLRYFRNFIPYGRDGFDAEGLARVIQRRVGEEEGNRWEVSGKTEVVERLRPYTRQVLDWDLFYDNPAAGAIYKRVGFRDIGTWDMVPARGGAPGAASAG